MQRPVCLERLGLDPLPPIRARYVRQSGQEAPSRLTATHHLLWVAEETWFNIRAIIGFLENMRGCCADRT